MTSWFLCPTIFVLIAAAGIGFVPAPVGSFGQERVCPIPESFYEFEPPLVKTAKALASGREVVIVALGGASTLGVAAGRGRSRLARAPRSSAQR